MRVSLSPGSVSILRPGASEWEHLNAADDSTEVQNQGLTLRDSILFSVPWDTAGTWRQP